MAIAASIAAASSLGVADDGVYTAIAAMVANGSTGSGSGDAIKGQ